MNLARPFKGINIVDLPGAIDRAKGAKCNSPAQRAGWQPQTNAEALKAQYIFVPDRKPCACCGWRSFISRFQRSVVFSPTTQPVGLGCHISRLWRFAWLAIRWVKYCHYPFKVG